MRAATTSLAAGACCARDRDKDQSYFLYALGQPALAATRFPLGELHKAQVRELARAADLPNHAKKDSTGICFIGERDFPRFLSRYIPAQPGPIHTPDGDEIGMHEGVFHYTLGQRGGLRIGGRRDGDGSPWYVVGKDVAANVLYAAQGNANRWLQASRVAASELSWIAGSPPADRFDCTAMTRYRQPPQRCTVTLDGAGALLAFAAPQRAVTPGQSVVFYDGEVCLGGGVIDRSDAAFGGWSPT